MSWEGESGGKNGRISSLASSLLWVSDVPKGSSGQEEYGQTDGNPMLEPVRLPALRVHDGRARSVQRSDAMVNGRFDEKGPLIGDVARHVDDGAVSFGFQVLFVL